MHTIRSIVALDLEATGIPSQERYSTKITELALVACERDHCLNEKELPRILHKLVVPLNPMKAIGYGAYRVSGLSNDILENTKPFDDGLVQLISNFLGRLPQPVCLVAHNGNRFDFPILQKHLINCKEPFPDSVYCADSWEAFKEIFPKHRGSQFGTEDEDAMCVEALEKLEKSFGSNDPISLSLRQTMNERTPENKTNPTNQLNYKGAETNNVEVRRILNFEDAGGTVGEVIVNEVVTNNVNETITSEKNENGTGSKKKFHFPDTYRLRDIYRFLHDGKVFPEAHRAENDTVALLSCIVKSGAPFANWLDTNAKLFSEVHPIP